MIYILRLVSVRSNACRDSVCSNGHTSELRAFRFWLFAFESYWRLKSWRIKSSLSSNCKTSATSLVLGKISYNLRSFHSTIAVGNVRFVTIVIGKNSFVLISFSLLSVSVLCRLQSELEVLESIPFSFYCFPIRRCKKFNIIAIVLTSIGFLHCQVRLAL